MYVIVDFLKKVKSSYVSTGALLCVPKQWITEGPDKGDFMCYYPKQETEGPTFAKELVSPFEHPHKFRLHAVKYADNFKQFETYEEGDKALSDESSETDAESSNENHKNDSSTEDSSNDSDIELPPKKKTKKDSKSKNNSGKRQSGNSSSNSKGLVQLTKSNDMSISPLLQQIIRNQNMQEQEIHRLNETVADLLSCNKKLEESVGTVKREGAYVHVRVDTAIELIEKLVANDHAQLSVSSHNSSISSCSNKSESFNLIEDTLGLPCDSKPAFEALNQRLESNNLRCNLRDRLSKCKGSTREKLLCSMMSLIMSNKLGMEYTFYGRKQKNKPTKPGIKDMLIVRIFKEAFLLTKFKCMDDSAFIDCIMSWLKNAPLRHKTELKASSEQDKQINGMDTPQTDDEEGNDVPENFD